MEQTLEKYCSTIVPRKTIVPKYGTMEQSWNNALFHAEAIAITPYEKVEQLEQ